MRSALPRPARQLVLVFLHLAAHGMAGRRHIGRIEQDKRREIAPAGERLQHRALRRHRMKHAGGRLLAEFLANGPADRIEVGHHMRVIVVWRLGARVLAVAAHVEHDDIEAAEKPAPEIEIAVDRKPVAVAEHEPRSARIAVPAHPQPRAVCRNDFDNRVRRRDRYRHPREIHAPGQPRPG